jgi:hypothetical protein
MSACPSAIPNFEARGIADCKERRACGQLSQIEASNTCFEPWRPNID